LDKLTAEQIQQLIERLKENRSDTLDAMEYCLADKRNYEHAMGEMLEIFNNIKIKLD